jgi:hypothetical protein
MHLLGLVLSVLAKITIEIKESIIQYLIQQIAQSEINNRLSLIFLLHVSTSTGSSSERYIQRHTSTADSVKDVCVELKYNNVN